MQIAKPAGGFHVQCRPQASDMAARLCNGNPSLEAYKDGIIKRLREAGHMMGKALDWQELPGARIFIADNPPGLPVGAQIWIIYRTLGDTLTFHRIQVSNGLQAVN